MLDRRNTVKSSGAESLKRAPCTGWAVHFAGDQEIKWALDEDLRWARLALDGDLQLTSAWQSRILHAAWWPSAWQLGTDVLRSQRVVCFVDNAPSFYARQPEFQAVSPLVDTWVARSTQAVYEFSALGIHAQLAPYCADPRTFFPLPPQDAGLQAFRRQLELPEDAYIIGNFHSDTAFTIGPDQPKWQKGPDVFVEIVRQVREAEPRVCVLLAGPRRHWLRGRLKALGVPVFFVGREIAGDDFATNILDRATLNRLYNLLNLCMVCSRWEGGPHSIFEACFSKTKVLSTRVGIAEDILQEASLFNTIPEGVDRILEDVRHGVLDPTSEPQYDRALTQNSPQKLSAALRRIYESFPQEPKKRVLEATGPWLRSHGRRLLRRRCTSPSIIGMISERKPGGLFEFLRDTLRRSGAFDLREKIDADCRHYLVDAGWLQSNDPKRLATQSVVWVCDHFNAPLPGNAMILPSFKTLTGRTRDQATPRPLVIPPFLDGTNFGPQIPVTEQLTSTVSGVAQAIRQLFVVLDSPEDVRWLGFR